MYLATTTGDFGAYTHSQAESMAYIKQAGFRFLDYNFGSDYSRRDGVYSENWREYLAGIQEKADELGVRFIQSHSPMGAPIADGNDAFTEDTIRCVEACGILGIPTVVVHSGYIKGLSIKETFEKIAESNLKITKFDEDYIEGTVNISEGQSLLCTSITFDEGWIIEVDGKRAELIKINDSQIAVEIPEGAHKVTFTYRPKCYVYGSALSVIGLLSFAGAIVYDELRKEREKKQWALQNNIF